jgi:hypothetical protein
VSFALYDKPHLSTDRCIVLVSQQSQHDNNTTTQQSSLCLEMLEDGQFGDQTGYEVLVAEKDPSNTDGIF